MSARQKRKKADSLPDTVASKRIHFAYNGDSRMLVHEPCYNGEIIAKTVEGIIQTVKVTEKGTSDKAANYEYRCECCGESWSYE